MLLRNVYNNKLKNRDQNRDCSEPKDSHIIQPQLTLPGRPSDKFKQPANELRICHCSPSSEKAVTREEYYRILSLRK